VNTEIAGTAEFSSCKRYRYLLTRQWEPRPARARTICFIGLNPSTADANVNDATVRKCIAISAHLGFTRLKLVNLFAFRATEPADLKEARFPIGEMNDDFLDAAVRTSGVIVACWGNHGVHQNRDQVVAQRFKRRLKCLKVNATGTPAHPLYLPTRSRLLNY
jgi:hypothetical protein